MPDEETKRRIFQIHTGRMTLADDVDLEEYIMAKDDLSGADIKVEKLHFSKFIFTLFKLCSITGARTKFSCLKKSQNNRLPHLW